MCAAASLVNVMSVNLAASTVRRIGPMYTFVTHTRPLYPSIGLCTLQHSCVFTSFFSVGAIPRAADAAVAESTVYVTVMCLATHPTWLPTRRPFPFQAVSVCRYTGATLYDAGLHGPVTERDPVTWFDGVSTSSPFRVSSFGTDAANAVSRQPFPPPACRQLHGCCGCCWRWTPSVWRP